MVIGFYSYYIFSVFLFSPCTLISGNNFNGAQQLSFRVPEWSSLATFQSQWICNWIRASVNERTLNRVWSLQLVHKERWKPTDRNLRGRDGYFYFYCTINDGIFIQWPYINATWIHLYLPSTLAGSALCCYIGTASGTANAVDQLSSVYRV